MEPKDPSPVLDKHSSHEPEQQCDFCSLIDWTRGKSLAEVWERCPRASWLVLVCGKKAGQSGWPTRAQIVLAVRALAQASVRFQLHEATEIAGKWEAGEATIEQLSEAVDTAIAASARTAAYAKIAEYAPYSGDASAFAIDAAAVSEGKILEEAADILRAALQPQITIAGKEAGELCGRDGVTRGKGLDDSATYGKRPVCFSLLKTVLARALRAVGIVRA